MDMEDNYSFSEDDFAVTVRLLATYSEVGCIIGEKESILKHIRRQSGASVSISEGSIHAHQDRVVSVTGNFEEMYDACKLIIQRFEAYAIRRTQNNANDPDGLYVKLIVPASQCGTLIGKGGSKIKEIKDSTGASMQVAADMLPNSTERVVNISGLVDSILDCIYEISYILLSTPQKVQVIPYRPNSDFLEGPIIFSEGKAYTLQGSSAVPIADLEFLYKNDLMKQFFGLQNADYTKLSRLIKSRGLNRDPNEKRQSFTVQEMRVPSDTVGSMFRRHSMKISEIRQITGAIITLNDDERTSHAKDRLITIKGTAEGVALAKYLINASIELQKMNPESQISLEQNDSFDFETSTSSLTNSLTQPGALSILSSFTGFQNISEFLSSFDTGRRY